MKVLYVTSNGGIHDYRFVKKLSEDYEVLLLHYASREPIDEIKKIKHIRLISRIPAVKSFPLLSELGNFKKIYNEFKPDIVHTGYVWQVGILASAADVHPHLSMVWGSDILIEPDRSRLIKYIVKKVMNQCDHIQCDAEIVKKKIIQDYKIKADKITVFPWGIDLNLFKPLDKTECRKKLNLDEKKFIVIFNRHLEGVYGIKYLLRGFKKFSENKNDVLLMIVSGGTLKKEAEDFIKDNRIADKIKFIGPVPNSELPLYLNASDVYLSTSLSDGTSLSLLEAMACGTGIAVTEIPAILEWVNSKNGIIIRKKNSDDVSSALEKFYRDDLKHSGLNRKIINERADWEKNYLKLRQIYNNLK